MTPRRRFGPFATGVLVLGVLWVTVLALPQSAGYVSAFAWFMDRVMISADRPIDRPLLAADLGAAGFGMGDDVYIRIFKRERRLEVWMRGDGVRYRLFRAYDICTFSGELGPKLREGDRQAPEGFYRIQLAQLNPDSRHHLAFNTGFPNEYDRQLGRTGSVLMVHGGCSSIGCYAMTDGGIDQIYAVVEAALASGQDGVDVAIFPFVLSAAALAAEAGNSWHPFWANLKQGFDLFETAQAPPAVAACNGQYRFGAAADGPGCLPIRGWQAGA